MHLNLARFRGSDLPWFLNSHGTLTLCICQNIERIGQWVGAQGQAKVAKKMQKHPHLWRYPQRTPNQKRKIFFSMSTRRLAESVECLNSSLGLAAGDLCPKNCEPIYWLARSLKGYEVVKCTYQVRHPRKHSLSALKCSFEASAFSYCIVSAPLLPCWSKTGQWNLHFPCVLYKS